MLHNKSSKIFPILFFVLIPLVFISCSASSHAGLTYVQEPALSEVNEYAWFSYYQDQFDAFEGMVVSPTDKYPQVARQAYQRAAVEWADKVSTQRTVRTIAWIGGSIFVPALIYLIVSKK